MAVLVWPAVYRPQNIADEGCSVGSAEGAGEGAVGHAEGKAVGGPGMTVGLAVGSVDGAGVGLAEVGNNVGSELGINEGKALGAGEGGGLFVGRAEGAAVGAGGAGGVGAGLGLAVITVGRGLGREVGIAVGAAVADEGAGVGTEEGGGVVGADVGENVTNCTPAPLTATVPVHWVLPVQPSLITYVCVAAPTGGVYCTCAQVLPLAMHADGGLPPFPVLS